MVIVVMLDALSHKYLAYECPFLSDLMRWGLRAELVPCFGFNPDAVYLAGLYPEECDGGLLYWHEEAKSPFGWTKTWTWALTSLPEKAHLPFRRFVQMVNFLKERELGRRYLSRPVRIPIDRLHYFSVAHPRLMFQRCFAPTPTIFDLLSTEGKKWAYFGHPMWRGGIKRIFHKLQKQNLRDLSFAFIMVGDLDFAGHTHGTQAGKTRGVLRDVDSYLRRIYELFAQHHRDPTLVVFGDHGMTDVQGYINVDDRLRGLKARPWVDYDYFLDSTFARFWFRTEGCREEIIAMLADLPGGRLLSDEDRACYRARYPHNKFGDVIFWADGGQMILPNFFQGANGLRGMHGYRREVQDNHSGLILFDPRRGPHAALGDPVDMVHLFPSFLQLLDLPARYGKNIPSLMDLAEG